MGFRYLNVCLLVFFLALPCNAAYYEEPPQITQCRQSIIDAPSVPGGGTSYTYPQKCGLLQAYRNIYNAKENVIGEFTARSCGECASVCVAHAFGGYKYQYGLAANVIEFMNETVYQDIQEILKNDGPPCTDWVWCDPYEDVAGEGSECAKKFERFYSEEDEWGNSYGLDYRLTDPVYNGTNVRDPFSADNCLARWYDGKFSSYRGYGNKVYLQGSQKGCTTHSGRVIPAGTCTLKHISSTNFNEHVWGKLEDRDLGEPLMSGMCDWTLSGEDPQ